MMPDYSHLSPDMRAALETAYKQGVNDGLEFYQPEGATRLTVQKTIPLAHYEVVGLPASADAEAALELARMLPAHWHRKMARGDDQDVVSYTIKVVRP